MKAILTSHFPIAGALLCRVVLGASAALAFVRCQNGDDLPYCEEQKAKAYELAAEVLEPFRGCKIDGDCIRIAEAGLTEELQTDRPTWSCAFGVVPAVNRVNLREALDALDNVGHVCNTKCTLKNPGVVVIEDFIADDLQCKARRCFPAIDELAHNVEETGAGTK